jgi:hypothetical protein
MLNNLTTTKSHKKMKTRLIFTLFAVMLLISCEKDKETDPRDAYIGTWQGTETQVYSQLGTSETYDVTYVITKGTETGEIIITNASVYEFTYHAIVSLNAHTYEQFHLFTDDSGISVYFQLTGGGNISGKQINENGNLYVSADGTEFYGTWYRTLHKK